MSNEGKTPKGSRKRRPMDGKKIPLKTFRIVYPRGRETDKQAGSPAGHSSGFSSTLNNEKTNDAVNQTPACATLSTFMEWCTSNLKPCLAHTRIRSGQLTYKPAFYPAHVSLVPRRDGRSKWHEQDLNRCTRKLVPLPTALPQPLVRVITFIWQNLPRQQDI